MSKLISMEAFAIIISHIKRAGGILNERIQLAGIAAVGYSILHNDTRPANTLVESMPKGTRKDALVKWLEVNGNLAWSKEGNKFLCFPAGAVFDFDKLLGLPWHAAKKEAPIVSEYDVQAAFDKFMATVKSMKAKGTVNIVNAGLFDELQNASGKYNLSMSKALTDAHNAAKEGEPAKSE